MDSGNKNNEPKLRPKRRRYNLTTSSTDTVMSNSGRRPTYAQWIAKAVASAPNRAMTLADINDWMIKNVPGLEEQRYLHSCKGWKNAVRHTLSINRHRFRKVPQSGKPSFWCLNEPDPASAPFPNDRIAVIQPAASSIFKRSSPEIAITNAEAEFVVKSGTNSALMCPSDSTKSGAVAEVNGHLSSASVRASDSPGSIVKINKSAFNGYHYQNDHMHSVASSLHTFIRNIEGADVALNDGKPSGNDYHGCLNGTLIATKTNPDVFGLNNMITSGSAMLQAATSTTVQQLDVLCQDGTVKKLYLPSPLPLTDMNLRILCSSFVPDVSTQTLLWSHLNRTFVNDSIAAAAALSMRNVYNVNDIAKAGSADFIA